eukprot:gnl/TRDRNA2_/TRDRNA2_88663_c0_seq2.p1 gnl/TRDRNA2_/TRDRNA2_88663_c0~~gnl/TRDRNA2_/TRDRNA2_88663_c0_seq2.p1  ORF type:complete len:377 (+),score=43.12 gnl/TRDRNA2_/TRDRNA2_88663_c0_seq2:52-1182(+)
MGTSCSQEDERRVFEQHMLSGHELGPEIQMSNSKKTKTRAAVRHGAQGQNLVHCPSCDEVMGAKIAQEGLHIRESMHKVFCGDRCCDHCEKALQTSDAYYRCHACDVHLCMNCTRDILGLPVVEGKEEQPPIALEPGDILMCWPNITDAHHVILVTGILEHRPDLEVWLNVEPGIEVWGCESIESTGFATGETTWWNPARVYFGRNPHEGTVNIIADEVRKDGEEPCFGIVPKPIPFKIMLSPLRPEFGGPGVNQKAFLQATEQAASQSLPWSPITCAKALVKAYGAILQDDHYTDPDSRAKLLERLQLSWEKAPICSSVPVKCWQQYFLLSSTDEDEAVTNILKYMPVICNHVTPSILTIALTGKGWVLRDNLEP